MSFISDVCRLLWRRPIEQALQCRQESGKIACDAGLGARVVDRTLYRVLVFKEAFFQLPRSDGARSTCEHLFKTLSSRCSALSCGLGFWPAARSGSGTSMRTGEGPEQGNYFSRSCLQPQLVDRDLALVTEVFVLTKTALPDLDLVWRICSRGLWLFQCQVSLLRRHLFL